MFGYSFCTSDPSSNGESVPPEKKQLRYELSLELPYDGAKRRLVGIGDGDIVSNLFRELNEEQGLTMKAEDTTIQEQAAEPFQSLFEVDQSGNIRLVDSAAFLAKIKDEGTPISLSTILTEHGQNKSRQVHVLTRISLHLLVVPAVTNLSALSKDRAVVLSWHDSDSSDIDHLEITWSDGSSTQTAEAAAGIQTYTASGLTNDQEYTFTVRVHDRRGTKSSSVPISATPEDTKTPDRVSAISRNYDDASVMLTLRWINPSDEDFVYVRIEWGEDTIMKLGEPGAANSHTFSIDPTRSYSFQLISVDDDDRESSPQIYNVGVLDSPPGAVSGLSAQSQDRRIVLSWNDPPDSDIDHVDVTWSDGGNTQTTSVAAGIQTYTASGLANDQEYTFTVRVHDNRGTRSSTADIAATPEDTKTPDRVSAISRNYDDASAMLTLRWINPSDEDFVYVRIEWEEDTIMKLGEPGAANRHTFSIDPTRSYSFQLISVDDDDRESEPQIYNVNTLTLSELEIVIPPDQDVRLPDLLFTWEKSKGGRFINIDIAFSIQLELPYDPATGNVLGEENAGNLIQKLREKPNITLEEEVAIEEQTPSADLRGLIAIDPNGDLRLLNKARLAAKILAAGEDSDSQWLSFYAHLYEQTSSASPPRSIPLLIDIKLKEGASVPAWSYINAVPRNSFGRVLALGGEDADLRYELVGEHEPFIIDPLSGRLAVEATKAHLLIPSIAQILNKKYRYLYTYSLSARSVRVAVTDQDGHRAEEDVRILPALPSEDCDDLPNFINDEDGGFRNWACKNAQPISPKDPDDNAVTFTTDTAYTDALPDGLTYPKSHYKIVFADEFSTSEANTNYPAVKALDNRFWELRGGCPQGAYLRNGNLYLTTGGALCGTLGVGIITAGKFEYRYGYIEIRFTRVMDAILDSDNYRSLNITLNDRLRPADRRFLVPADYYRYNHYMCGDDTLELERLLKVGGVEHVIFEYRTTGGYYYRFRDFAWNVMHFRKGFCGASSRRLWIDTVYDNDFVSDNTNVDTAGRAYTVGMEWTPRGYLYFKNGVQQTGNPFAGIKKDGYYATAISHSPKVLGIYAHTNGGHPDHNRPSLTIFDYIRVYQPEELNEDGSPKKPYAGMSKLYQ